MLRKPAHEIPLTIPPLPLPGRYVIRKLDDMPIVLILSKHRGSAQDFDSLYPELIQELVRDDRDSKAQTTVLHLTSCAAAIKYLREYKPFAIIIADALFGDPLYRPTADLIKEYIKNGGNVVYGRYDRETSWCSWDCGRMNATGAFGKLWAIEDQAGRKADPLLATTGYLELPRRFVPRRPRCLAHQPARFHPPMSALPGWETNPFSKAVESKRTGFSTTGKPEFVRGFPSSDYDIEVDGYNGPIDDEFAIESKEALDMTGTEPDFAWTAIPFRLRPFFEFYGPIEMWENKDTGKMITRMVWSLDHITPGIQSGIGAVQVMCGLRPAPESSWGMGWGKGQGTQAPGMG